MEPEAANEPGKDALRTRISAALDVIPGIGRDQADVVTDAVLDLWPSEAEAERDTLKGALREVLEHYHAPCPECWDVIGRAYAALGEPNQHVIAPATHDVPTDAPTYCGLNRIHPAHTWRWAWPDLTQRTAECPGVGVLPTASSAPPGRPFSVKQLVDAGWEGLASIEESKKLGVCIPGNNMAMAALANAVLGSLGICTCEPPGPDMHESRCALVRSGVGQGASE